MKENESFRGLAWMTFPVMATILLVMEVTLCVFSGGVESCHCRAKRPTA